jgi:hypothetical protein
MTSGKEAGSDPREPVEPPDPTGLKVTLWFLGSFVVGAYLTQLLVVGALYAAERFLP